MEFDYVVIGAGSAGCAAAARLSESARCTVVLLEAGGRDTNPWIHIPVGYFKTMGNPKTDWMYHTEPDPGLNGRGIPWPRGKVLGGSSSINGLLYVRGQAEDFDGWRQMGNEGWGWEDVLPYFKKAESWQGLDSEDRGTSGPLTVSPTRAGRDLVDYWIESAVTAGYKKNSDYNSGDQEGVGYFQLTQRGGLRCSSAKAYLKPLRDSKNLDVITHAPAEKVIISEGRVTGVVANIRGRSKTIKARKEVVLCAGSIGSPQILMLSGVGDLEKLKSVGIAGVKHLPGVGKNLQDHLQARPVFKTTLSTINVEIDSIFKQALIGLRFLTTQSGPMTMAASLGTGFLKTDERLATPDIQFHIQPFSADKPSDGPHKFSGFTASVLQMRPESVGHLELISSNWRDHPAIHPNYLSTETDQRTIVAGIEIARKISRINPLAKYITEEHAPGDGVAMGDYEAILNWARQASVTIYHPTGTCKMGKDDQAVVDTSLRVHGIEGLRVADASIMPTITSGNTNAPCIMIGEKVASMILEDAAA